MCAAQPLPERSPVAGFCQDTESSPAHLHTAGRRERPGRGACATHASNTFPEPGSRPRLWAARPTPSWRSRSAGVPPGGLAEIHTEERVSSHPAPTVAKETHASGQAASVTRCQSGNSRAVVTAAQTSRAHCLSRVRPQIKGLQAASQLGWGQGGSRRAHSFAFSPPAPHDEREHARKGGRDPWPRCHRTRTGQLPCAGHLPGKDTFFLPHVHKENVTVYIKEVEEQRPNWAARLPPWASGDAAPGLQSHQGTLH